MTVLSGDEIEARSMEIIAQKLDPWKSLAKSQILVSDKAQEFVTVHRNSHETDMRLFTPIRQPAVNVYDYTDSSFI
jgi:hypothetical protein